MDELKNAVERLIVKAAQSEKSDDAMRFSQAACNASNAMAVLSEIEKRTAVTK